MNCFSAVTNEGKFEYDGVHKLSEGEEIERDLCVTPVSEAAEHR